MNRLKMAIRRREWTRSGEVTKHTWGAGWADFPTEAEAKAYVKGYEQAAWETIVSILGKFEGTFPEDETERLTERLSGDIAQLFEVKSMAEKKRIKAAGLPPLSVPGGRS
jgi:hypothetical protein